MELAVSCEDFRYRMRVKSLVTHLEYKEPEVACYTARTLRRFLESHFSWREDPRKLPEVLGLRSFKLLDHSEIGSLFAVIRNVGWVSSLVSDGLREYVGEPPLRDLSIELASGYEFNQRGCLNVVSYPLASVAPKSKELRLVENSGAFVEPLICEIKPEERVLIQLCKQRTGVSPTGLEYKTIRFFEFAENPVLQEFLGRR